MDTEATVPVNPLDAENATPSPRARIVRRTLAILIVIGVIVVVVCMAGYLETIRTQTLIHRLSSDTVTSAQDALQTLRKTGQGGLGPLVAAEARESSLRNRFRIHAAIGEILDRLPENETARGQLSPELRGLLLARRLDMRNHAANAYQELVDWGDQQTYAFFLSQIDRLDMSATVLFTREAGFGAEPRPLPTGALVLLAAGAAFRRGDLPYETFHAALARAFSERVERTTTWSDPPESIRNESVDWLRVAAATQLDLLHPKDARLLVEAALNGLYAPFARATAAYHLAALARSGEPVGALIRSALDAPGVEHEMLVENALVAFGETANQPNAEGAAVVERFLRDPRPDVRRGAAHLLGRPIVPVDTAARLLPMALADAERTVRRRAMRALERLSAAQVVALVGARLAVEPDERAREDLLGALTRFSFDETELVWRKALQSSDDTLKADALRAAARRPFPGADRIARAALSDPSALVQAVALRHLALLPESEREPEIKKRLPNRDLHLSALAGAAELPADKAAAIVRDALADGKAADDVRAVALSVQAAHGDAAAVPQLAELLNRMAFVPTEIWWILRKAGTPALPLLMEAVYLAPRAASDPSDAVCRLSGLTNLKPRSEMPSMPTPKASPFRYDSYDITALRLWHRRIRYQIP